MLTINTRRLLGKNVKSTIYSLEIKKEKKRERAEIWWLDYSFFIMSEMREEGGEVKERK